MAIKLYKSQLEPTARTSNVLDTRQVSLSEAASIGNAMKGMIKSGEKLYVKHQQIKSDNEVKEKIKEVMAGNDNYEGLSSIKLKASNMEDPDGATAYYAQEVDKVKKQNHNFSGIFAKKYFNNWINKQATEDLTTIKKNSTKLFIERTRTTELDYLETLKKKVLYAETEIERANAEKELATRLDTKSTEIFGAKIADVKKSVSKDIAFYGYKNVPLDKQDEALAKAEKDKRLTVEDVEKLRKHFKVKKSKIAESLKDQVKVFEDNAASGNIPNAEELTEILNAANAAGDNKIINRVEKLLRHTQLYTNLSSMSYAQVEQAKNTANRLLQANNASGQGSDADLIERADIINDFFVKMAEGLDKDPLVFAAERGTIILDDIGLNEFLVNGNIDDFASKIADRKSSAKVAAGFYKRDVKFLTVQEVDQINSVLAAATTPGEIITMATALVNGFGTDSDKVFKQLGDKNKTLAHIGGLAMMTSDSSVNVTRLVDGHLIMKNSELSQIYKISESNAQYQEVKINYANAFPGLETYNNVIEAADLIYASMSKEQGLSNKRFKKDLYTEALNLAVGGSKKHGGFQEQDRGEMVIAPTWLKKGEFDNVQDLLEKEPVLLSKAVNGSAVDINGKPIFNIFANQKPYFVTVGPGRYIVAMGDNPIEVGGEPEYVLNDKGGFLIIDLNKIKSELLGAL